MQVTPLFALPYTEVALGLDNQRLAEWAGELEQASPGDIREGGWQSPWLDLESPELKPLIESANQHLDFISRELYGLDETVTLRVANAWFNVNRTSEQLHNNYYHMHPGFNTALVYYVDAEVETAGVLSIIPPHAFNDYTLPFQLFKQMTLFNAQRWHVTPNPGKLVTFPAWLYHYAEPNRSGKPRICIAMNAAIHSKE